MTEVSEVLKLPSKALFYRGDLPEPLTDEEQEAERQRKVAASPFGIHEALHTCSVLTNAFGMFVAEHPAVALRPEILFANVARSIAQEERATAWLRS